MSNPLDQMRDDLDRADAEIEAPEAERDRLEGLRDAYDGDDDDALREMGERLAAMNGELVWLRAEAQDIEDVLPFERPDYSGER